MPSGPRVERPVGMQPPYQLTPLAARALEFMRRACDHLESGIDPLPAMAAAWALIEAEDNNETPDPELMEGPDND